MVREGGGIGFGVGQDPAFAVDHREACIGGHAYALGHSLERFPISHRHRQGGSVLARLSRHLVLEAVEEDPAQRQGDHKSDDAGEDEGGGGERERQFDADAHPSSLRHRGANR